MNPHKSAVIILAAGGSRRMGQAKQLLLFRGRTLLELTIEKALSTGVPVIVVLGARSNRIMTEIDTGQVSISINEHWQKGISSSLRTGIQSALKRVPDLSGVLVALADQPGITADHLRSLLREGSINGRIAGTEYDGTLGVPAYFPVEYFDQLVNLSGDQGARSILKNSPATTISIPFEAAAMDIDTQQDWLNFLQGDPDIDNSVN